MLRAELLRIVLNSSIITLLLVFNFVLLPISGGENHYLGFAKQFINPNWIPDSFSLTEFAGTRLIFQWITGYFMLFFDFESSIIFFRIINYVLISIPLALIFNTLNLKTFEWLIAFQLFIMSGQSFFGKEWIFGTFEPKTMAYAFVMFGFYFWLKGKRNTMVFFLALATYFHVLVGGWVLLLFLLFDLFNRNWKPWKKSMTIYILLIAPFLVYLISGYFLSNGTSSEVNTNFAYVYYRLPHHLGIALDWPFFIEYHLSGILMTLVAFIITFQVRKTLSGIRRDLASIVLIAFSINMLFVLVAIGDNLFFEKSGGLFLKYYPFRTNSFALFIIYLLVIIFISERNWFGLSYKWLKPMVIVLALSLASSRVAYAQQKQEEFISDHDFFELVQFIRNNTPRDSDIMILELPEQHFLNHSFIRLTERESFVVNKFVPAQKQKLEEWYTRELLLKKIRNKKVDLDSAVVKYHIDYVITKNELQNTKGNSVFQNDTYYLYRY